MSADENRQSRQLNGKAKPFVPQTQTQESQAYGTGMSGPQDYGYEQPVANYGPPRGRGSQYGNGGGMGYAGNQYGGGMHGGPGAFYGGDPMYPPGAPMGQNQMGPGRNAGSHHMNPNQGMGGGGNYNQGGPMVGGRGTGQRPSRGGMRGNSAPYYSQQGPGHMHMGPLQPPPPPQGMTGGYPPQHQPMGGRGPHGSGGNPYPMQTTNRPPPQHPPTSPPPAGTPPYQGRGPVQGPIPSPPVNHPQRQQPQQPVLQQQPLPPLMSRQQHSQMQQPLPHPACAEGSVPKVIMVTGYRRTGKTTVAKELARERNYEYISLVPVRAGDSAKRDESTEDAEDAENDDEALEEAVTFTSLEKRFAPLAALLARKSEINGIVIDDALILNKFEPYYVEFMLRGAGLHLDYLVIITTELSSLTSRGVSFNTGTQRKAHPESFEFGSWLETHNSATTGMTPIAVVDGECDLQQVVQESIKQLREVEARGLPTLELPEVDFIPGCSLVRDPLLADAVLAAERAALGMTTLAFDFPYSEPNYLLDYAEFARHALHFKQYMIVPWIWGDKVSLIGYDNDVFVHLPSYKIVFRFREAPAPLRELLGQLRVEVVAALRAAGTSESESLPEEKLCVFSLEAAMLNDVIYISDMMVLGAHKGSRMLLPDRVRLMGELLGRLQAPSPVRLLEHFRVKDIAKCLKEYAEIARGVLFKNPDGMAAGDYDDRNFIYSREDIKSVKVRIWAGRLDGDDAWVFDAYASNSGEDAEIVDAEKDAIMLVHVLNEDVEKYSLNDGDIVECTEEQVAATTSAQSKGGKRGSKAQAVTARFVFQKRCPWELEPTTLYYQSTFLNKPAWPTALFLEACKTIDYEAPVASKKESS